MDIVFEEYPRIIRNRVNPGMGVRMLGELVLEKISEERWSVESRGEVECHWFFRGSSSLTDLRREMSSGSRSVCL